MHVVVTHAFDILARGDAAFGDHDLAGGNELDLDVPGGRALTLLPGDGPVNYRATPRIGISAGKDLLWRFVTESE